VNNQISINMRKFRGINNLADPLDLKTTELTEGMNVDLDAQGRLKRRVGQALLSAGNYHNLWSNGKTCLLTEGGILKRLHDDFTTKTVIRSGVGYSRMSYVEPMGSGMIYYSNGAVIGYIKDNVGYTLDVPAIRDKAETPAGQLIEYYNHRLYVASGSNLFYTDPDIGLYFNRIDMKSNVIPRAGYITLLKAVQGGIYIADGSTWFLSGSDPTQMNAVFLAPYDAKIGTASQDLLDVQTFFPGGEMQSGKAVMWVSERGFCAGFNGGLFKNLSEKTYGMPSAERGSSLHRQKNGYNQFISILSN